MYVMRPFIFDRHVILPKDLAKGLPKTRVLSEQEWRGLGVQQSRGWMHYAIHRYVRTCHLNKCPDIHQVFLHVMHRYHESCDMIFGRIRFCGGGRQIDFGLMHRSLPPGVVDFYCKM